jgi:hypothetical protein
MSLYAFDAAVFVGGMEGVEQEYEMFKRIHPDKALFPSSPQQERQQSFFSTNILATRLNCCPTLRYLSLLRRLLNFRPT